MNLTLNWERYLPDSVSEREEAEVATKVAGS